MQLLTHTPSNRETWLNTMTNQFLKPHFKNKGYTIPDNIRFTCGFSGSGMHTKAHQKRFTLGQCFPPSMSNDNHYEIVIVPTLADPIQVVSTLIHELCHATVGNNEGHNHIFKRCAESVGLQGKMTATHSSEELIATTNEWLEKMPLYPHAEMNPAYRKQSTRNLACKCGSCGYAMRISAKWLKLAVPRCPLGHGKMIADIETEDFDE